jgi:hypothetical protein
VTTTEILARLIVGYTALCVVCAIVGYFIIRHYENKETPLPMQLIGLTLHGRNTKDGPWFEAILANTEGVESWLALPLDPIGDDEYAGRLKFVGKITA